ncbi:MAG: glycosidase, partial [Planctomycetota bacterium]|nr:glycosidase [Planctomycetota bacterium]
RAMGEGHVSSIVFRTGVIGADGAVSLDAPAKQVGRARVSPDSRYVKALLRQKLLEMNISGMDGVDRALAGLGESFFLPELERAVQALPAAEGSAPGVQEALRTLMWVARSNYRIRLAGQADLAQLVIYPVMREEIHGIEDLRLTRFTEFDGSVEYFGTYVAYDGQRTLPMLIRTRDFHEIEVYSINGAAALDKGMALFPRRIGGHYVMCSRIDGENLYIMVSDFVHFWETARMFAGPDKIWNLYQVGNCGPPVETPEGWILLTHGVGPMRTYSIGAMLLDLEDPTKILGRLRYPLLRADPSEREGYVPNVVYTCGSMIHGRTLYIPFALADRSTTMCAVEVEDLLARLLESPP